MNEENLEILANSFFEEFKDMDHFKNIYTERIELRFSKRKRHLLVLESLGSNYRKKIKKQKKQLQRACQLLAKLNKDSNYPTTERGWMNWMEEWSWKHGD